MTQKITAQMLDNTTVSSINNALSQMETTEETLSSGYRINSASDDPYGASETLSLTSQLKAYSSFTSSIGSAVAQSDTASTALTSMESIVESVRTLTVEGANSTENSNDLDAEATQVLAYIGQLKSMANAQYDGSYVFSGTATSTKPYDESSTGSDVYQGNTSSNSTLIGPNTTVSTSANLAGVLGSGTGSAGAYDSSTGDGGLLTTLRQIYTDMQNGDTSALSADLTSLDDSNDQLEQLQAQVGSTQDQLQMASTFISNLSTTATTQLGDTEDTDEATATIAFSTEENAFEAALKSSADIIQTSLVNFLNS